MSQLSPPAEAFVGHLVFLPREALHGAGRGPVTRPAYAAFQAGRAYPAFQARAAHPGAADRLPRTVRPVGGAYPALPPADQAVVALRVAGARLRRVAWRIVCGPTRPAPSPAVFTARSAAGGGADAVTAVGEAVHHDASSRLPASAWSPFSWSSP
ncbi:hypothetical protein [Streptomyces sp. NPDC093225]|uniref:hypothetical protein n=1 Tax=Streptomyces sp. NPDC093225 TaxID=3366034 RepID=UPI00382A2360